eukprot:scaffold123115_cov17-Tisochrysis_lutea.AAC.1
MRCSPKCQACQASWRSVCETHGITRVLHGQLFKLELFQLALNRNAWASVGMLRLHGMLCKTHGQLSVHEAMSRMSGLKESFWHFVCEAHGQWHVRDTRDTWATHCRAPRQPWAEVCIDRYIHTCTWSHNKARRYTSLPVLCKSKCAGLRVSIKRGPKTFKSAYPTNIIYLQLRSCQRSIMPNFQ